MRQNVSDLNSTLHKSQLCDSARSVAEPNFGESHKFVRHWRSLEPELRTVTEICELSFEIRKRTTFEGEIEKERLWGV
jgi:hypothetical protein